MTRLATFLAAFLAVPVAAEPVRVPYVAEIGGLPVAAVTVEATLGADWYRVDARIRTIGLASVLLAGQQSVSAEGRLSPGLGPVRVRAQGSWRGVPNLMEMDYRDGGPVVRSLLPASEPDRDPVSPALRRGTLDELSAVLALARQVALGGGCGLALSTYDGRRRVEYVAREAERIAQGSGPVPAAAARCVVEGRAVAGFRATRDRESQARPTTALVWFGRWTPDGPVVPLRIEAATRRLGPVVVRAGVAGDEAPAR